MASAVKAFYVFGNCEREKTQENYASKRLKIPLAPMGVLAHGSANA